MIQLFDGRMASLFTTKEATLGHRFADILFSDPVRAAQTAAGSRQLFEKWEGRDDCNHRLTERETEFLQQRDSFYLATVSPDGWPHIQHRGGPTGFIKIIDEHHIAWADFAGNRQYITAGNLRANHRMAFFFMDYPNRRRLKLLGRGEEVSLQDDPELLAQLTEPHYQARVERAFVITVEAFDWNCHQHITPRYDQASVEKLLATQHQQLTDSQ